MPLTIEVLGSGELVEISATEAAVVTPQAGSPSLFLCKDVDIHFDQKDGVNLATWGDDGRTIAPHQKLWYRVLRVQHRHRLSDRRDDHRRAPGRPPGHHRIARSADASST